MRQKITNITVPPKATLANVARRLCVKMPTAFLIFFVAFVTIFVTNSLNVFAVTQSITTDLGNVAPAITATVSDGGSTSASPTNVGSNVTFTTTAKDINGNQYYLAVCKTDAVTAGDNTAPICASVPNTWAISSATNSESQATVTYTTLIGDSGSNAWYAFVCDKVSGGGACYPATGYGDQGFAVGSVTFTGIPDDGATLTINSVTYEFDTAGNGITGGNTEADTSTAQVAKHAADALAAVEAGAGSHMASRSNIVYVYADAEGVAGNSIGITEANDTGNDMTLSGTNLTGGSDANASPFVVNHAPTFGTVIITDTATTTTNILVDGDMETSGVGSWFNDVGYEPVLTKQSGYRTEGDGSQVLRLSYGSATDPYTHQDTLTPGIRYRITGWARGDGVSSFPRLINSTLVWGGTTSATWQYFDVTFTAPGTMLGLRLIGTGYVEFDDISVFAIGDINPGDTLRFNLLRTHISDSDYTGSQDTINMYICTDATTSFNYSTNTCTGGSLICSDTAVNPTSEDASCDETGNNLVPPTDVHATENFKVYVEDVQDFAGTGTNQQSYTIQNTAPTHDTPELDVHSPVLPNSVGSWQFEDGAGAVSFDDETTNNNNGSCTGGTCPIWTQTGYSGGAYDFDGVDDFIQFANESNFDFSNGDSITLSAWINPTDIGDYASPTNDFGLILAKGQDGGNRHFLFNVIGTSNVGEGKLGFIYTNYAGVPQSYKTSSAVVFNNNWYHVALTYTYGNGSSAKIYLNGSPVTGSWTDGDGNSAPYQTDNPVIVGKEDNSLVNEMFEGYIDEPHIYNRALSATEISNLYTAYSTPTATSNMDISAKPINIADHDVDTTTTIYNWKKNGSSIAVLNMPFDSNISSISASAVLDYSGNANHGTLGGGTPWTAGYAPTWTSSGIKGGAYDFDGTDDYIAVSSSTTLGSGLGNNFTIEAWLKTSTIAHMTIAGSFVADGNYGYRLNTRNTDGVIWFQLDDGSASDYVECANCNYDDGVWHHVVGVRTPSQAIIYFDGQEKARANSTGSITISENFKIGATYTALTEFFNGFIDEVHVYDSELTSAQIAQNYNNGKPNYNTIAESMTSAADTSWVADVTINDAQSVNSNSTTKSTNTLDPANTEPVQGTPSARAHATLDSGSVGYWQLEDGDSATAFDDETTNNNNGSCTNCPTFTEEGVVGGAYDFDGVDDYINISNYLSLNNSMTISLWHKLRSSADDDPFVSKGGWGDIQAGAGGFYLRAKSSGHYQFSTSKTGGYNEILSTAIIPLNQWTHLAVTIDQATGYQKLYINGVQDNSGSGLTSVILSGNDVTTIGSSNPAAYIDGLLDEVHIYNRALSATEIKNLYNSNSYVYGTMDLGASARSLSDPDSDATYITTDWRKNGTSAAVLNMSFNKNVTSLAAGAITDYSSYGNNGQLGGGYGSSYAPTWTNASTCGNNTGGCYSFDGGDYISSPDNSSLEISDTLTVSAWIKLNALNAYQRVISKWDVNDLAYILGVDNANKIGFAFSADCQWDGVDGPDSWNILNNTALQSGQWYHVAGVHNGNTIKIYVNGVEGNSRTGVSSTICTTGAAPLAIGVDTDAFGWFNGLIDEPHVYNRALTASQIAADYNAGKSNYQNLAYGELAVGDTWKANVTAFDANGNEDGTMLTNELEVLGFSTAPSDGSSSATTPTTAGNNVTFTATYNAPSSRQWYLAICKTNEVTAGNDAAPTCATDQTWAISSATTDANEATATYTTSSGDAETNVWYAFACDKVASTATCSPASQGTGNTGSPFVVNHTPALGTVKIGSQCGDNAPVAPGNSRTMKLINGVFSARDNAWASVIQSDGKIVAAGASNSSIYFDFGLVRYNTDGSLDTSFGNGGKVRTPMGSANSYAYAVALQSDGKIVAAGRSYNGSNYDIAIVRYNSDGTLDDSFDGDAAMPGYPGNGKVTTAIGTLGDEAYSVAIQSDGKIVIGGYTYNSSTDTDMVVVRYNANGTLDTTFDTDGKVTTAIGSGYDDIYSILIQSDGKIVAGGDSYYNGEAYNSYFAVVRYNTNGSLDTGFGTGGKVTTSFESSNFDYGWSTAVQSDGKILLGGYSFNGSDSDFAIVRYNTNGTLDTSFDTDGKVTTAFGTGSDDIYSIAIQSDGKIVAGGDSWYNGGNSSYITLARYNTDGSLDTTFDTDGKVTTAIGNGDDYSSSVKIQSDGKIISFGSTFTGVPASSLSDFVLVRYNTNGSLDSTFDHDGKATTEVWSADDYGYSSAYQSDGKILVAGYSGFGSDNDIAVARYNADGTFDTTFDNDGKVTTAIGSGSDVGASVAVQNDGKIIVAGRSYNGANDDFAVVRYNTDGTLDTTFDTDGKVTTPVLSAADLGVAVLVQSDGKIVVAGYSSNGTDKDFAVVRYNSDGSLDTTFDTDGKVTTPVLSGDDTVYSAVLQSDGKIILAGWSNNGSNNDFALVRYNTNGSLDTDFDTDGKLTTAVGSGEDYAFSIKIQIDGKIVVSGVSHNGTNNDFAVVRYNTNGSPDTDFDTDGKLLTAVGSGNDYGYSLAIQSDGKIVVGGYSHNGTDNDFAVVRYNTNGSLDTGFDTDGKTTTAVGTDQDYGYSVAVQNEGEIALAGYSLNGTGNNDFALVRYNTDGSIDSPADYMCVQGAITDTDSTDTVDMYVCSANSFTAGETPACAGGGTELCKITGVKSGGSAQCLVEDLIDVPTAHGTGNVYVFIVDSNGLQGTGTSTQSYTVADVAPQLVSYTATDTPDIAAGGFDTVDYSAVISDANGDNDVTAVEGILFDDTAVNNNCASSDNNCYIDTTCDISNVSGTDANLTASCSSAMWFNSNASTNWEVNVKPTDGIGKSIASSDSNVNLENPDLAGVDVTQDNIAYGQIEIGGVSARKETSMGNMGNLPIDVMVSGTNMCTDSPTCAGSVLSNSLQKWYHTNTDFNWGATATNPGPYSLVTLASGTDDETGCLNRDVAVRTEHASTSTNESIWWKLRIPNDQTVGTYTGENTFATTASSTCSAGQSY